MAALQGGYMPAHAARDTAPMRIALDMAIDQIRTFATAPARVTNARQPLVKIVLETP